MKPSEEHELNKWLSGSISDAEVKKSIGSEDVLKYEQILEEVNKWVPDNDSLIFDPKHITDQVKETKVRSLNMWIPTSIAASILIVISAMLWFFVSSDVTTYSTELAEKKEILLPDGKSKITLASNSEVSWSDDDWELNERTLSLSGKAFFEVEKGGSFEVNMINGKVEVLGTTFEIEEFEEGLNVVCYEGTVKATAKDEQSVIVEGGEGYLYYKGKWEDRIEIVDSLPAWLEGETKFKKAPLIQVIKSIEKQYEIKVIIGSVNLERRFTGSFPNDKLELVLKIVFDTFNIEHELKGDKLYLSE